MRLQQILNTMDVPKHRKHDLFWLKRNLPIRNSNHPNLEEALQLIRLNLVCELAPKKKEDDNEANDE